MNKDVYNIPRMYLLKKSWESRWTWHYSPWTTQSMKTVRKYNGSWWPAEWHWLYTAIDYNRDATLTTITSGKLCRLLTTCWQQIGGHNPPDITPGSEPPNSGVLSGGLRPPILKFSFQVGDVWFCGFYPALPLNGGGFWPRGMSGG